MFLVKVIKHIWETFHLLNMPKNATSRTCQLVLQYESRFDLSVYHSTLLVILHRSMPLVKIKHLWY